MQRWEYFHGTMQQIRGRVQINGHALTTSYHEWLNIMGREGWELVSAQDGPLAVLLYFKRPLPQ